MDRLSKEYITEVFLKLKSLEDFDPIAGATEFFNKRQRIIDNAHGQLETGLHMFNIDLDNEGKLITIMETDHVLTLDSEDFDENSDLDEVDYKNYFKIKEATYIASDENEAIRKAKQAYAENFFWLELSEGD